MSIGWAIIGCGWSADRLVAPAIAGSEIGRLVACCSRRLERAADFADRHGADRGYDQLADVIDDPDVQAVYIATPNVNHCSEAISLLNGGKHVLCASPLAGSAEEAERMIEAAVAAGKSLGVAQHVRHLPGLQLLADMIADGALGRLTMLRAGAGVVRSPGEQWRLSRAHAGGGALMDLGSQVIDALHWLAGEVVAVSACVSNVRFHYEVEDAAAALLELECGAVAVLDAGFGYADSSLSVFGDEGTARLAGAFSPGGQWAIEATRAGATMRQAGESGPAFGELIESFSAAVEQGRPPPVSCDEGLRTLEVIEAIYESAACGERIELEEAE